VRFTNIPDHSSGFIPFARVEHPKYLVRDGREAWLGTSNWSRSYFQTSRNLSLFLSGGRPVFDLVAFFDLSWHSQYAEIVDAGADYQPPRRKE
jgi:phosphatidylserine/phosphatidylglycerophosphate/cardiolipin synthase-like enzyme